MEQFDASFLPLLSGSERDHLQENPNSVFGFWPDLRLAYFNDAWSRFAAANWGEPRISSRIGIGTQLTDAISPTLRSHYADRYRRCLAGTEPWSHEYGCSGPDLYRKFHMIVYPLKDRWGGLVVNSLIVEEPHDPAQRLAHTPVLERYADEHGILHQCMQCRRTRRGMGAEQWDWVPAWVAQYPGNTSHGLCQPCLDYYYPDLKEDPITAPA